MGMGQPLCMGMDFWTSSCRRKRTPYSSPWHGGWDIAIIRMSGLCCSQYFDDVCDEEVIAIYKLIMQPGLVLQNPDLQVAEQG
eukprot:10260874-Heterocapsa_arctica.AAC.1